MIRSNRPSAGMPAPAFTAMCGSSPPATPTSASTAASPSPRRRSRPIKPPSRSAPSLTPVSSPRPSAWLGAGTIGQRVPPHGKSRCAAPCLAPMARKSPAGKTHSPSRTCFQASAPRNGSPCPSPAFGPTPPRCFTACAALWNWTAPLWTKPPRGSASAR